jgi:hypothetical protein
MPEIILSTKALRGYEDQIWHSSGLGDGCRTWQVILYSCTIISYAWTTFEGVIGKSFRLSLNVTIVINFNGRSIQHIDKLPLVPEALRAPKHWTQCSHKASKLSPKFRKLPSRAGLRHERNGLDKYPRSVWRNTISIWDFHHIRAS